MVGCSGWAAAERRRSLGPALDALYNFRLARFSIHQDLFFLLSKVHQLESPSQNSASIDSGHRSMSLQQAPEDEILSDEQIQQLLEQAESRLRTAATDSSSIAPKSVCMDELKSDGD